MLHTIDYVAKFDLIREHEIRFKRIGGIFFDTIEVKIDNEQILLTTTNILNSFKLRQYRTILDAKPCVIFWRYDVWGDPKFMALATEKRVLAKYGDETAIAKLGYSISPSYAELTSIRILKEECLESSVQEIDTEEFPLDNRAGSDALSIEHEISKTLTTTFAMEAGAGLSAKLGTKLVGILEAEICANLSRKLAQSIGTSITRRQQIRFSVKPGLAVTYIVVWKHQLRRGRYTVVLNENEHVMNYEASSGLSFEVKSRASASGADAVSV